LEVSSVGKKLHLELDALGLEGLDGGAAIHIVGVQ